MSLDQTGEFSVGAERRRAPRLDVFGRLDGYIVSLATPAVVLDVSTGGLGVALKRAAEVDEVLDIRLTSSAGEIADVRARVAYCRPSETPAGTKYFAVGLQLVDRNEYLDRIIDELTSALSFDTP